MSFNLADEDNQVTAQTPYITEYLTIATNSHQRIVRLILVELNKFL